MLFSIPPINCIFKLFLYYLFFKPEHAIICKLCCLIILVRLSCKIIRRGYDSLEFMGGGAGSFLSYVFICLSSHMT